MSPFLLIQKKKLMTHVRVQKKQKKTLKYKLYANQVMLLVIRLTMKKNNITKLLQFTVVSRRSVLEKKHTHTHTHNEAQH